MSRLVRPATWILVIVVALAGCKKSGGTKPPDSYPDTAAGFGDFARDLIDAVKDDRKSDYEALAASLQLPDPKAWFAGKFGDDVGARLATEYDGYKLADFGSQSWPMLKHLVIDEGRTTVATGRHDRADDDLATGHQAVALRAAKQPLALYTLQLTRPDGSKSFTLWSFVHDGTQFRLVGHMKMVKPIDPSDKLAKELDMLGELPIAEARKLMKEMKDKASSK